MRPGLERDSGGEERALQSLQGAHYTVLCLDWCAGKEPGTPNGRRFIDGDVSLGDKLPNLQSEIYALVKKGNYRKYIDRILYTSLVKITPNVCLKSWKVKNLAKNFTKSM